MGKKSKTHFFKKSRVAVLASLILLLTMVFPLSRAEAAVADQLVLPPVGSELIPLGKTTGIKLFSEGAVIVGFSAVTENGGSSPALDAGLAEGDIIIAVNDEVVDSNEELVRVLSDLEPGDVQITVKRNEEIKTFTVKAEYSKTNERLQLGAWVRDSMAGIGTITFVDPKTGIFGALGHGVSDVDTGKLMPINSGSLMASKVESVVKGEAGTPGELKGSFDLSRSQGDLTTNTMRGVFGKLNDRSLFDGLKPYQTVGKSEIVPGKATIIANVEGEVSREYEVEILKIYGDNDDSLRDMMVQVTDKALLSITGGIVQGMSGSPLIQNGKLVGAITHVLVNDPTRGYAISIERMLQNDVK